MPVQTGSRKRVVDDSVAQRMRATSIVSEAWRNVASGASRGGLLAICAALLSVLLLAADMFAIAQIQARAERFRESFGSVRILVAEDAVDPEACEKLDELPGIHASGSLTRASSYRLAALPGAEVPGYEVSPGLLDLLGTAPGPGEGFYVSNVLAERWEMPAGTVIATDLGTASALAVFDYSDQDGRDPRLSNALVTMSARERASECWVDVWPYTTAKDHLFFSVLLADDSGTEGAQIVAANSTAGETVDFNEQFISRITVHVYPTIALLFAALGFAGMLRRRLEIVSNLHAGATRAAVTATAVVETALWAFGAAVLCAAASVWIGFAVRVPVNETAFMVLGCAVAAAMLGASVPPMWIGEERLFTDFKNRT